VRGLQERNRDVPADRARTAPGAVTSATSPKAAAKHVELLAAADALTIHAADRLTLATASGELVDLDHAPCWLWLAPNENTATIQGVLAFTAEYRTAPPVDLPGWEAQLEIGVKLSAYNEGVDRRDRFNEAAYASGRNSPSGGLQDMSIAHALTYVDAHPPRALAATR
jgi:hypothetical protein